MKREGKEGKEGGRKGGNPADSSGKSGEHGALGEGLPYAPLQECGRGVDPHLQPAGRSMRRTDCSADGSISGRRLTQRSPNVHHRDQNNHPRTKGWEEEHGINLQMPQLGEKTGH